MFDLSQMFVRKPCFLSWQMRFRFLDIFLPSFLDFSFLFCYNITNETNNYTLPSLRPSIPWLLFPLRHFSWSFVVHVSFMVSPRKSFFPWRKWMIISSPYASFSILLQLSFGLRQSCSLWPWNFFET